MILVKPLHVEREMLGLARQHFKVLGPVVCSVAVDVMSYFARLERATEYFFQDQDMLLDTASRIGARVIWEKNNAVSAFHRDTAYRKAHAFTGRMVTGQRAVLPRSLPDERRLTHKFDSTPSADTRDTWSILSRHRHLPGDGATVGAVDAAPGPSIPASIARLDGI